ncbi:DUF1838 family protein [Microtetraspora niveoalba]|uniref:DUF1838 family protein n=1 Tax=Microtetraspora niveoalba TaxID=46175 RepID=UPI000A8DFBF8|nr:DUF1838 family protein [Microtetraspora niveoalba]
MTSQGMTTQADRIAELDDPAGNLEALVRARAGTDGREHTIWWSGDVYSQVPGEDTRRLFGFVGFNVARAVRVDGGYDLLTREAAFYLDPVTREIVETWRNPFTGEDVEVLHVWNDPVNQRFRLESPYGPWHAPYTDLGETVVFNLDIPISAPSALPVAEWPKNSAGDVYRAMELFQFYAPRAGLLDPAVASVRCDVSWMRLSAWLPWMEMAQRPGGLVFHCRGAKLDSYDDLPAGVRAYVGKHHPEYAHAPEEFTAPNETSWTYFKKTRRPS